MNDQSVVTDELRQAACDYWEHCNDDDTAQHRLAAMPRLASSCFDLIREIDRLRAENQRLYDSLPTIDNRTRNRARELLDVLGSLKRSDVRPIVEGLLAENSKLREQVEELRAELLERLGNFILHGGDGIWPDWVYEARNAVRHQSHVSWLPELLAALGWQGGTIHAALNCVRRLVASAKQRNSNVDSVLPLLPPEWNGDTRDPNAGCWHVVNAYPNSSIADNDHCRRPCVVGTRYCDQHQRPITEELCRELGFRVTSSDSSHYFQRFGSCSFTTVTFDGDDVIVWVNNLPTHGTWTANRLRKLVEAMRGE